MKKKSRETEIDITERSVVMVIGFLPDSLEPVGMAGKLTLSGGGGSGGCGGAQKPDSAVREDNGYERGQWEW
jgi:hypothetical protein